MSSVAPSEDEFMKKFRFVYDETIRKAKKVAAAQKALQDATRKHGFLNKDGVQLSHAARAKIARLAAKQVKKREEEGLTSKESYPVDSVGRAIRVNGQIVYPVCWSKTLAQPSDLQDATDTLRRTCPNFKGKSESYIQETLYRQQCANDGTVPELNDIPEISEEQAQKEIQEADEIIKGIQKKNAKAHSKKNTKKNAKK